MGGAAAREAGVPVTIVERGKPVQPRRRDLALHHARRSSTRELELLLRRGRRGDVLRRQALHAREESRGRRRRDRDLVRFGAPDEIAVDARPHVGSNRLPRVLQALREHLVGLGVDYRFEATVAGLRVAGGRVRAVRLAGGDELPADVVVLAVGHSARAVYAWAAAGGVALERKPFAIGVRIEHPQRLIDEIQYGDAAGHPKLPPAFYELTSADAGRGVYSFCMCPGGWIVPAATEADGVVVNGMSLSRRDSPFANAGLVVTVERGGLRTRRRPARWRASSCSAGSSRRRSASGGGGFRAPAQRLGDFLDGRASTSVGASSYRPGLAPADLRAGAAAVRRRGAARGAAPHGRAAAGLPVRRRACWSGPRRAPARRSACCATRRRCSRRRCAGLYPCGEGAGYAGGIVSAALDGARVARA